MLLSFFLMLRSPLTSTLFPYTTLFRSVAERLSTIQIPTLLLNGAQDDLIPAEMALIVARAIQDRKSTRLNSSHRCISYAVFCLKKKNHMHNVIRVQLIGRFSPIKNHCF